MSAIAQTRKRHVPWLIAMVFAIVCAVIIAIAAPASMARADDGTSDETSSEVVDTAAEAKAAADAKAQADAEAAAAAEARAAEDAAAKAAEEVAPAPEEQPVPESDTTRRTQVKVDAPVAVNSSQQQTQFDLTASCVEGGFLAINGSLAAVAPWTHGDVFVRTTVTGPSSFSWTEWLGITDGNGQGTFPVSTTSPQALSAGEYTVTWQALDIGPVFAESGPVTITCSTPEPPVIPEPTVITPLPPQFADFCGTENDEVQLPSDTDEYFYTEAWDGNVITVTVQVREGVNVVFPKGSPEDGTTTTLTWTFEFTDEECPVVIPTQPEPKFTDVVSYAVDCDSNVTTTTTTFRQDYVLVNNGWVLSDVLVPVLSSTHTEKWTAEQLEEQGLTLPADCDVTEPEVPVTPEEPEPTPTPEPTLEPTPSPTPSPSETPAKADKLATTGGDQGSLWTSITAGLLFLAAGLALTIRRRRQVVATSNSSESDN